MPSKIDDVKSKTQNLLLKVVVEGPKFPATFIPEPHKLAKLNIEEPKATEIGINLKITESIKEFS